MATPTLDAKRNGSTDTLLPPEERFWQRYSPHHEAPLSGVGSFVVHGLVIGVLILGYMLLNQRREAEANRPVTMDVVELAGGGSGFEGGGGEPGTKAAATKSGRTGDVFGSPKTDVSKIDTPTPAPQFEKVEVPLLGFPETPEAGVVEITASLRGIAREAEDAVNKAMKIAAANAGNPDGGNKVGKGGTG